MSLEVALTHDLPGFTLRVGFEASHGITVLFGRSGSGKSTIINAVAGLLRPDQGRISLGDRQLFDSATGRNMPPHRRGLGVVFQEGRLFPHLTVRQNLGYARWFTRNPIPRPEADRIIEMLGIGGLLERWPTALSGGEKQRVAIGRALFANPRLILADEPLAALDETRKAEILPYFERLRDETDVPILYVSHAPAEVARLATTVVALQEGHVVRQGSAQEVLGDPMIAPTGVRGVGAVLDAVIREQHADGLTELSAGDDRLTVPAIDGPVGASVRVRLAAQDVLVARVAPEAISALNILPATVAQIRPGSGPGVIVALQISAGMILARVTRRSADALGLAPEMPVFAVVKSVALAREDVSPGVIEATSG